MTDVGLFLYGVVMFMLVLFSVILIFIGCRRGS